MIVPDVLCPRCGRAPIEVAELDQPTPRFVPACSCYPHPPACVCCHEPLEDERCPSLTCPVYAVLQPCPDVDPLWEQVQALDDPPTIVEHSPAFERLAAVMEGRGKVTADAVNPSQFGPLRRSA